MNDVTKTEEKPRTIAPEANVIEEVGKMTVKMEMPGVSKANLDIQVKGQEVTVVGRRQDEVVEGTWLLRERRRGDFQKTYSVDGSIDLDKIEASLNNGILTLTLPMKEAAKPRRIEIKST